MNIRCGLDLVEISRIESAISKGSDRFLERIFTASELDESRHRTQSLAGYYAAKEAVAKALGTGLMVKGIRFTDIEILKDQLGAPMVKLSAAAKARYDELGGKSLAVSITHEKAYAAAVCYMVCDSLRQIDDR